MGKKSNLMHQAIKQLNKQKKFGESKFDAKKAARQSGESTAVRGIYSTATYNSYVKVCKQFIVSDTKHTVVNLSQSIDILSL